MDQDMLNTVLNFIKDYLDENNQLSPTVREVASGCYMSTFYARRCLDVLEARGAITRHSRKARSIRLQQPVSSK
jgi:SOS-response transcriptional repressor LexA